MKGKLIHGIHEIIIQKQLSQLEYAIYNIASKLDLYSL